MNWLNEDRESYPAASSHHQTLLGKALYEHGNCELIAAVASSSSSIQNSSLGPNLLALVQVDEDTIPLFASVFVSRGTTTKNTTLQFTRKLLLCSEQEDIMARLGYFTASLINNTKYFQKSLQEMEIALGYYNRPRLSFWSVALTPSSCSWTFTSLKKLRIKSSHSEALLQNLATMFPVVEELGLQNLPQVLSADECFQSFSKHIHLTSLDLSQSDSITDADIQTISACLPAKLTSLDLSWCGEITDDGIRTLAAAKCVNLTSLDLSWCKEITDAGLQAIGAKFVNLTYLNLANCYNITDAGLQAIATSCANLAELTLHNCDKITDAGLQAIAASCTNLTSLDLAHCRDITDAGIEAISARCVNLTELRLFNCAKITDAGLQAITANCVHLTSLSLSGCERITDVGKAKAKKALPNLTIWS